MFILATDSLVLVFLEIPHANSTNIGFRK